MNTVRRFALAAAAAAFSVLAPAASAGPPLICFPNEIGGAKSLPFGKDAFEVDKKYDAKKVVDDTLGLLKTERSALVRMETLRRATVYLRENPRTARELLGKIAFIALDGESDENPAVPAEAWFNAGVLAAMYRQCGIDIDWKPGVKDGLIGYAWVCRALESSKSDAEMEFAAALVAEGKPDRARAHLKAALAGAPDGSPLARSIQGNLLFGGKSAAQLRDELGVQHVDAGRDR